MLTGNNQRYVRSSGGLDLYSGDKLIRTFSPNQQIAVFFSSEEDGTGSISGHLGKHGCAVEVGFWHKQVCAELKRSGQPLDGLHVISVQVNALTDAMIAEINVSLADDSRIAFLGYRITKMLLESAQKEEFRAAA